MDVRDKIGSLVRNDQSPVRHRQSDADSYSVYSHSLASSKCKWQVASDACSFIGPLALIVDQRDIRQRSFWTVIVLIDATTCLVQ